MIINPIYKRDQMLRSRNNKLMLILLVFNGILAVIALINMYTTILQAKLTAKMNYSAFLDLYLLVTTIEFILLSFFVLTDTAGSISKECENHTLDLLLSTNLTAWDIIIGKLSSSLTTIIMLAVSSLPIVSLVFIYGGVTVQDLCLLLLCYITAAIFMGSLGICFSAISKRTVLSTIFSYAAVIVIFVGTYGLNYLVMIFSSRKVEAVDLALSSAAGQMNTKGFLYFLLLNPAVTFYTAINQQIGSNHSFSHVSQWFGIGKWNVVMNDWILISILIQLLISVVLLAIAVRAIKPLSKKNLQLT